MSTSAVVADWIKRIADDERRRDTVRVRDDEMAARKADLVRRNGRRLLDELRAERRLMNTAWVVIALGIAVAVVALATSWRRGGHPADFGTVSHQWIAEHRLGSGQDSRR